MSNVLQGTYPDARRAGDDRVNDHAASLMRGEAPASNVVQFRPRGCPSPETVTLLPRDPYSQNSVPDAMKGALATNRSACVDGRCLRDFWRWSGFASTRNSFG